MALNTRVEACRLPEDYPDAARRVFTSFRDHPNDRERAIQDLSILINQAHRDITGDLSLDLVDRMFKVITLTEQGFEKDGLSKDDYEVAKRLIRLANLVGSAYRPKQSQLQTLIKDFNNRYAAPQRTPRRAIMANVLKEPPHRASAADFSQVRGIHNPNTNCFLNSIFQAYLAQFPGLLQSFNKADSFKLDDFFEVYKSGELDLTDLREFLAENTDEPFKVGKTGHQDAMDTLRAIWNLVEPKEMRSFINTSYPGLRKQYSLEDNSYFSSHTKTWNVSSSETSFPVIHIEPIKNQETQQLINRALNAESNLPLRKFQRNDPYFYQSASVNVQATKQTIHYDEETLPDVLTLAVDRFKTERSRIWGDQHVKIYDGIKLSPIINIPTIEGRDYTYELRSFIVHQGNLHGGHYIAYRKVGDVWYECNDNETTSCDSCYALSEGSNAYIVFYEKVGVQENHTGPIQQQLKDLFLTEGFSNPRFQELFHALKLSKDLDSDSMHLLRYIKEVAGLWNKKEMGDPLFKEDIHYKRCMLPLMIRHFGKDKMTRKQITKYSEEILNALKGIDEEEDSLLNTFVKDLLGETYWYLNPSEDDAEQQGSLEPTFRDHDQPSSPLWGNEDHKHNGFDKG